MVTDNILKPERNCWKVALAKRSAILIHSNAYFSALAHAMNNAKESILIIGWNINSQTCLIREHNAKTSPVPLSDFLIKLVKKQHGLNVHILNWDFATAYLLNHESPPIFDMGLPSHPRIHFRFDAHHPIGNAHHQKIVVIDDAIAFLGGMDICRDENAPDYAAHEVQIAVDGEAASVLGDLARERWLRATDQSLARCRSADELWPDTLIPDFENVEVAISRTLPTFGDQQSVREIEALYLDSIAAARKYIYIENQYLTSHLIGQALCAALSQDNGPEIVIVTGRENSGWLDDSVMSVLRARCLANLLNADHQGRLRVYFPSAPDGVEQCIKAQANLMICDDKFVRIGSSNINNRSMAFDTECDLAIEGKDDQHINAGIISFRNRLLAERLNVTQNEIAKTIQEKGSLIAAIETLQKSKHTLQEAKAEHQNLTLDGFQSAFIEAAEQLSTPEHFIRTFIPQERESRSKRPYVVGASIFLGLLILAALWRYTPLQEWVSVDFVVSWFNSLRENPMAPILLIGCYTVATFILFPRPIITIAIVLTFGAWLGFTYALTGVMLAAALTYWMGKVLGRDAVRRLAKGKLNQLSLRLRRKGFLAVLILRLVPVAPFIVINMVAGASQIRLRDFLLGTLLGILPGTLISTLLGGQLHDTLENPNPVNIGVLVVLFGLMILSGFGINKWLTRKDARAIAS